jgi:hypothetical protein
LRKINVLIPRLPFFIMLVASGPFVFSMTKGTIDSRE